MRRVGGNFGSRQNKRVGGGGLERRHQNWVSFPPPQLFPFSTRVLTVLENDAAPEKTCETIEYQANKVVTGIQNCLTGG